MRGESNEVNLPRCKRWEYKSSGESIEGKGYHGEGETMGNETIHYSLSNEPIETVNDGSNE
jgi:hypothetical protein